MFSLFSRNVPKSLWGETALMLITLDVVLGVLWGTDSRDYFMGVATVCYGFVIDGSRAGWRSERK
jgi:hypothetical protein